MGQKALSAILIITDRMASLPRVGCIPCLWEAVLNKCHKYIFRQEFNRFTYAGPLFRRGNHLHKSFFAMCQCLTKIKCAKIFIDLTHMPSPFVHTGYIYHAVIG